MAIKGSLREAALPDVIQLLYLGRRTGCLAVADRQSHASVYFEDGWVVYAAIVNRRDRLGDMLVKRGRIIGLIALDGMSRNQFNEHDADLALAFVADRELAALLEAVAADAVAVARQPDAARLEKGEDVLHVAPQPEGEQEPVVQLADVLDLAPRAARDSLEPAVVAGEQVGLVPLLCVGETLAEREAEQEAWRRRAGAEDRSRSRLRLETYRCTARNFSRSREKTLA